MLCTGVFSTFGLCLLLLIAGLLWLCCIIVFWLLPVTDCGLTTSLRGLSLRRVLRVLFGLLILNGLWWLWLSRLLLLAPLFLSLFLLQLLLLHLPILLQLLLHFVFSHRGRDSQIQVAGTALISEWWSVVAGLQMPRDGIARFQSQQTQFEVIGAAPGFHKSCRGGLHQELGRLSGLAVYRIVQRHIPQQEVRIFSLCQQWHDRVGRDFEVTGRIQYSHHRALISTNLNWIHRGFGITAPFTVLNKHAVESGEGFV